MKINNEKESFNINLAQLLLQLKVVYSMIV